MIESTNGATFNLGVVLQETGLKPDTLRAWERRYGLPKPQRSPGGHRLYTQQDIAMIKWLMDRQQEKMSISKAVELWRRLDAKGEAPRDLPAAAAARPAPVSDPLPLPSGLLADVRQAWVGACKQFDEQQADAILAQAFALFAPEAVCREVLLSGLAQLGAGWYQGEVIVQQEHFATELAKRRLEALIQATPPPTRPGRILMAAPSGENHDLILLLLVLLLRRRSLDVLHLGPNVPVPDLLTVVSRTQAKAVIASAQRLRTAAALQEMGQALFEEEVPLLYGGRIFNLVPELRRRIAGHFIGERIETFTQVVESFLAEPEPTIPPDRVPRHYQRALQQFRAQLPRIEADVLQNMAERLDEMHLSTANMNLAQDIQAALALGNMEFLGGEIAWVKGLLSNHHLPGDQLRRYLAAYRQAAHRYLDEAAGPIIHWLDEITAN